MATNPKPSLMALLAGNNALSPQERQEAQQPQPIALQTFDSVPGWAIVHAAADEHNAPLIRSGEVVVAERGRGWMPVDGGLFLVEYVSAPATVHDFEKRHVRIVQTRETPRGWYVGGLRSGKSGAFVASDGPYTDPTKLAEKLVGRVVGILRTASFIDRMAGEAR
ncbi:hypothetical protein ASE78_05865 [Sphingomonas sp. Leaf25]|nr:hypothetical protein ASE78_05865 [Sphingomonas sp. Leaf25]